MENNKFNRLLYSWMFRLLPSEVKLTLVSIITPVEHLENNFVKEVARTIHESKQKNNQGSFIFGISGKWGEGKTYFLDQLRESLEDDFYIVDINPWKFASERDAFLRHFLTQISEGVSSSANLDDLRYESTINKLSLLWHILFWTSILLIVMLLIVSFPASFGIPIVTRNYFAGIWSSLSSSQFWENFNRIKMPLLYLFTAVLIPPLIKLMSFKKKKSSVSTLDEFNLKLDRVLRDAKKPVVLYVDDLDRVTPKIAREVLDNMRTFFDRRDLTFVVTGDHSVLESYLGIEILPGSSDEGEQIEEGRRYLKKIFNIYWRMLPCSETDFEKFIHDYISNNYKDELNEFLNGDSSKFEGYLKRYFKQNYRQVIRFIDFTAFSFRAAKAFRDNSTGNKQELISEIFKFPYLLVKVLLLQDLCNPLYESIIADDLLLTVLEKHISSKQVDQFEAVINNRLGSKLSGGQKKLSKKIFEECENFYENSGSTLRVKNSKPFLYLSADEGWGDVGGAQPPDFFDFLTRGDSAAALGSIATSGEEILKSCGEYVIQQLKSIESNDTFEAPITTLMKTLISVPRENSIQKIFAVGLRGVDITKFLDTVQPPNEKRALFYTKVWPWLDIVAENEWFAEMENDFIAKFTPLISANDFTVIEEGEGYGSFSSKIICDSLASYFKQGSVDRVDRILSIKKKVVDSIFAESFEKISQELVNALLAETNEEIREKYLTIILSSGAGSNEKLLTTIEEKTKQFNSEITAWISNKIREGLIGITQEQFEGYLAQGLRELSDPSQLPNLLIFCNSLNLDSDSQIWAVLMEFHRDNILNLLPDTRDAGYVAMAIPTEIAKEIYKALVDRIKEPTRDQASKNNIFDSLYPNKWLWAKHPNIDLRSLTGMDKIIDRGKIEDLKKWWKGIN